MKQMLKISLIALVLASQITCSDNEEPESEISEICKNILDQNADLTELLPYAIGDDQTVSYFSISSEKVLTFEAVVTAVFDVIVPDTCTQYYKRTTVEFTQPNGSHYRLSWLPQLEGGTFKYTTLKASSIDATDPQVLTPSVGISNSIAFEKVADIYTNIDLSSSMLQDAIALVISEESTTVAILYLQKDVGLAAIEQDGEIFVLD